jgi:hypothetical protein
MGLQPTGRVPGLRRIAERVVFRSIMRWFWRWIFLGFCLLAAVAGGSTVDLPHAQVAAAAAGISRSAQGPAGLPQTITFDQPPDTTVGRPVTLTASSVTTTSPPAGTGLLVSFRSDTPATCTVSGSIATPTAAGFCVITATQGGGGKYAAATDVARAFRARAGSEPQIITFNQPVPTAVGQPITLTASSVTTTSPSAGTGLPVSFRSDTPDACTVSGVTVTPTTADVCTVTALQGGSDRYAAAQSVQRSFQAHTGTIQQTITFAQPPPAILGQPVTLSASTDAREPLVVSFRSGSPPVCTVSGTSVTTIAAGTCAITASQGGSDRYAAAQPVQRSFQVTVTTDRFTQQILWDPVPGATVGVPVVLTASSTVVFEGPGSPTGLPVSYSSRNQEVCTVSGATVVPLTAGRCVITASQAGSTRYLPATAVTQVFPVVRASQTISFTPPASATIGQPVTLTANASSWLPVTYASGPSDVCTLSGSVLTLANAGTCTVTASQPGNDQYAPAAPVTGSIAVQKIPQTISFSPPNGAEAGQRVGLSASATSKLAVSFTSDTPGVCTVSGSTATTIKDGTCAIIASQGGNDRYAAAEPVRQSFPVARIPQRISFSPPNSATAGQPVTLTAKASSGLPVSFTSSTSGVCTVSGSTATTIKAGTCTVTASQPGNDQYAPANPMTASFPVQSGIIGPGKAQQDINFGPPPPVTVGQPDTLGASATSGLAVSFRSDTPGVCTVSGSTATTITAGTCTVTASQAGNGHFAAARDVQRSFAVRPRQTPGGPGGGNKASQTIIVGPPPAATPGQVVPLTASATSGLPVTYTSSTPAVCTVSGSTATTITAGTCTVTADQAGDSRYLAAPEVAESFQVHAGPEAQTITFGPPPQAKVGEAVTLSASATSGLAVSFRSDTPRICTVSGSTLTPTAAGTCTVTASQGGSDRYSAAGDVDQSFDVAQGTSIFPGALIIPLSAAVFAAAGVTGLVRRMRRVRRRSRRPPEPPPSVRAAPVPGPPALVSVQNTGAGVTHTVHIESSPGPSITTIKEARP